MAKTKRKHLAALTAMERQTPPMHHDVRSDTVVESHHPRKGCRPKVKQLMLPSSASLPRHLQMADMDPQAEEGEGDPTAEVSHPYLSPDAEVRDNAEQNVAPVAPSSPYLRQQQGNDSDTDSWVDVRKQRVVIIIPPMPTAKPRFLKTKKQAHWDGGGLNRAKAPVENGEKKLSMTEMYNKSTENDIQRSRSSRQLKKESVCAGGAPPISGMDILLASALDTEHTTICTPRQGRKRDRAAADFQEAASLDTADSSAQPKSLSLEGNKGLKAMAQIKEVAHRDIKKRRMELCKKSAPLKMGRNGNKAQQIPSKDSDVPDLGVRSDSANSGQNRLKQNRGNVAALSCNEALKILMLKKHLEKAGGLRRWLCSVGLGQFKEAFEKRLWSEGDLLQLQMDDLKRMGKDAVGPRRKLIWAINHLSLQLI